VPPRSLANDGIRTRVVSLPCWELFEQQDQGYRDEVLPPAVRKRVSVEAGVSLGWERWVGDEGAIVGLDHFGASAPAGTVFKEFGFTVERVTDVAKRVLRGRPARTGPDAPSRAPWGWVAATHRSAAAMRASIEAVTTIPATLEAAVPWERRTGSEAAMTDRAATAAPLPRFALGEGTADFEAAIEQARAEDWATRLFDRDTTLWSTDRRVQEAIADRLGWLDAPEGVRQPNRQSRGVR
jgi:hypothetical protein